QTAVRLGVARNTVLARMARFGLRAAPAPQPPRSRPAPLVAPSRVDWEPRRVALLRVDVEEAAVGLADASGAIAETIGKVHTIDGEIVELGRGALVAAFGLEPVEDAPVRAALAALAILKASERARTADGGGSRVKIVVHVAHALVSPLHGAGTIDL